MHRLRHIITRPGFWPGFLLIAAILLRVAVSVTSVVQLPATSDEASSALLAEEIAKGARPLLFVGQPYQFPFESYLMAPLTNWMPNNAFGARYQALILGWLSFGMLLWATYQLFPRGKRWPALMLLLFPSAYWLQHQAGYTPPQYAMTAFLGALIIAFSIRAWRTENTGIWVFLAGLCGGLLFSNHALGLSVIVGSAFLLLFRHSFRHSAKSTAVYLLGLGLGLIPYFAAELAVPGANDALGGHLPFTMFYHRLVGYALPEMLPGALGIDIVLHADVSEYLGWPHILRKAFLAVFIVVFLWAAWPPLKSWAGAVFNRRFPRRHPIEMFLVTTAASLVLLALSKYSTAVTYRYLLPAAWCAPFIVGYVSSIMPRISKKLFAPLIMLLVMVNLVATGQMLWFWAKPGYLEKISDTPDMSRLLTYLKASDTHYCYASFWFSYRITYESNGEITCSMPYNERFPNWPIPFKAKVDEQPDVPYILTNTPRAVLNAVKFTMDLASGGIHAKPKSIPPFIIYSDFSFNDYNQVTPLQLQEKQVKASTNDGTDLGSLVDNNIETIWNSGKNQRSGMYVEVKFPEPVPVQRISQDYSLDHLDFPHGYDVMGKKNGQWKLLLKRPSQLVHLRMYKNKPVYQDTTNTIYAWLIDPEPVEAIRIEIAKPMWGKPWSLAGIELAIAKTHLCPGQDTDDTAHPTSDKC